MDGLEILILDEADRLLEMGFTEEVRLDTCSCFHLMIMCLACMWLLYSFCKLGSMVSRSNTGCCWCCLLLALHVTVHSLLTAFVLQVQELVKLCPVKRQTMLFSATMTHDVDKLAAYSLKRPVRITADSSIRVDEVRVSYLNQIVCLAVKFLSLKLCYAMLSWGSHKIFLTVVKVLFLQTAKKTAFKGLFVGYKATLFHRVHGMITQAEV